jgi:hypothetical protein
MGKNADGRLIDAKGTPGRRRSRKEDQYGVNTTKYGQGPASQPMPIVGDNYFDRTDTRTFKPIAANWDLEEFSEYCTLAPP